MPEPTLPIACAPDATQVRLDEAALGERLLAERFQQHLRRQRLASLSGALPSAYLAWLLADQPAVTWVAAWWGLLLALDLASFFHAHSALRTAATATPAQRRRLRWRQIALQTCASATWSLAIGWVSLSPAATISVVAVLVSVYCIGVLGMLTYRSAVLSFTLGMWAWPMVHMFSSGDPLLAKLSLGVLVLGLSMNFFLWEASRDLLQGLDRRLRSDAQSEALQAATERIARLAAHDELTGCLNRREGMAAARQALAGPHATVALLMFDIDHFKAINDHHGHPAGDRALQEVGARLRRELRSGDLVARVGGEEFLVVLRNAPADKAAAVAERLRAAVAQAPVAIEGGELKVTASIGWTLALAGEALEAAIARADAALYEAKQGGRNQVRQRPDMALA